MGGKSKASELLELASEVLPPRTVRRVQRVINSVRDARSELGLLGELATFATELDTTPNLVEIAPGVFVHKPHTPLSKLRRIRQWRPSR